MEEKGAAAIEVFSSWSNMESGVEAAVELI